MAKRPQQQRHYGGSGCGIWTERARRGIGKPCRPTGSAINIRENAVFLARSLQDRDPGQHHLIVEEGWKVSPAVHHVCQSAWCEKGTFLTCRTVGIEFRLGKGGMSNSTGVTVVFVGALALQRLLPVVAGEYGIRVIQVKKRLKRIYLACILSVQDGGSTLLAVETPTR